MNRKLRWVSRFPSNSPSSPLFWVPDRYFKATYGEDPSDLVKKRFRDEIARIYKVLDGQLEQQKSANSEFIVLNRMTVVDIAFYGWVSMADFCQM